MPSRSTQSLAFMKTILARFLAAVGLLPAIASSQQSEIFITVTIPESIMPVARGEKYEDPLDAALKKAGVGEVTGAGSLLSAPGVVGAVNIEVRLTNLSKGLPLLKERLRELGAPKGSSVEFSVGSRTVKQPLYE